METNPYWIFILALPVACIAWTVTKEEVFREPREYCVEKSKSCKNIFKRKLFYMLTCEYCFSHYVTLFLLVITKYTLLYPDWRGYLIAGFSIVWIANVYMSIYNLIRIDLKKEKLIVQKEEEKIRNNSGLSDHLSSEQQVLLK
ncbi:MFS transporter [Pedobacter metabolipauper]|uniref:DUF1360 domain-containing protein n=1 Tax=Pedobacter metabolipauper TaxID=425513 RepID=A0A4R6T0N5_9SPHI|nr:hypothetical protein [Pedobacter metabolipauper]TDQ11935.1 hypothetical protein ATK78_1065 [Pedobacter metabolipauper]